MLHWVKSYGNQYFGFWPLELLFFLLSSCISIVLCRIFSNFASIQDL